MLECRNLRAQWAARYGKEPGDEDLERLYAEFTPLQTEVLLRHCDVIPGVTEVMRQLRARGVKVGNTTGFDSGMIEGLIRSAAEYGYTPDVWVTPDLVGKGRPAPWMAFYAARALDVYPMSAFVKVGDTPADVEEAHAAGMWAVSVLRHGNEVGLSRAAVEQMEPEALNERLAAARARLAPLGPHYIIDSTADLVPVVDEISGRIARGDRP
jgi:phosphonoacetaldehyde hydrolase